MEQTLNSILNTEIKVNILRLFAERLEGYHASGREIARQIETTAPSAHAALKALYDQHILLLEPIGRSHVYALNRKNRVVKDILLPAFSVEKNFKEDVAAFIKRLINKYKLQNKVVSAIFYGSRQSERSNKGSDADIAVIVGYEKDLAVVSQAFIEQIAPQFYEYFGITLDAYIKTKIDFMKLFKKNLPPVSTLINDYEIIYGQDILKREQNGKR